MRRRMKSYAILLILGSLFLTAAEDAVTVVATAAEQSVDGIEASAQFLPVFVDGQLCAYQIANLEDHSMLQRMGLRSGDLIVRVNGIAVSMDFPGVSVINALSNSSEVTLDLKSGLTESRARVLHVIFVRP